MSLVNLSYFLSFAIVPALSFRFPPETPWATGDKTAGLTMEDHNGVSPS